MAIHLTQGLLTVQPVAAADFLDVPYSPAFLLDSLFDVSITDTEEFSIACRCGFESYFEGMFEWNEEKTELIFVEQVYAWEDIVECVVETALAEDQPGHLLTRSWRSGYGLGWLSALALVNQQDALRALSVLTSLLLPSPFQLRRDLVD